MLSILNLQEMWNVTDSVPVDRSKLIQQLTIVFLDPEEREEYLDRLHHQLRGKTLRRLLLWQQEFCSIMDNGLRSASDDLLMEIAGHPAMILQIITYLGFECNREWVRKVAKFLA